MKMLTICTVCYNSGKTIERCIKSVVSQLTDEVEYLIIDGKSSDNTIDIIKKYSKDLKYVSEKDNGIYDAMNKGIKMATGKYILFMNSDDYFNDGAIKVILQSIKSNKDCYYGDANYIIENKYGKYIKKYVGCPDGKIEHVVGGPQWSHQSFLVKVDRLKQIGYFDEQFKIIADWDSMVALYKLGCSFEHIDYIISDFTIGGTSSKSENYQRHLVRKKHKTYKVFDFYYVKDLIRNSIVSLARFILGSERLYYIGAVVLKFKKIK